MNEDNFLEVAKQAALGAGEIIKKNSGKFGEKSFKEGDRSNFATKADTEAEARIVGILEKAFPQHNIIAEENAEAKKGSEYTWVIDPLDGSFSYAHNIPQFSISIGLLKNNKPILGVIYHISSQDLSWALEDKGAYLNGKAIHVGKINNFEESAIYLDFGHHAKRQSKFNLYIKPLMDKVGRIYSMGSAALGLVWVGTGSFDGCVIQAWVWDFAAGAVIVREAGGKVTDFEGNEPDWSKQRLDIVASNGLIHNQILEALKR